MIIKQEDIMGYYVGEQLHCEGCMRVNKVEVVDLEKILFREAVEKDETLYFCDICKEKID